MSQYLSKLGRKVCLVNLDPANESLPYECSINVCDLITLEDIQEEVKLGPNGAFIYALDFLRENISWLLNQLKALGAIISCLTIISTLFLLIESYPLF
jgi:hypothetical protein